MLFFKKKKIDKANILVNNIYEDLMRLDHLISIHGMNFDEGPMVEKLTKQLDALWDCYWELADDASKIQIKYIGLGASLKLNEVLDHLLFVWFLVIIDKLDIHNLSNNWVNYAVNRELWNNRKKII
jgi:hypothetical protein